MTNQIKETEEFISLQKELLKHKRLYYVESTPIISDNEYDALERKSIEMAKQLGFRADRWEDAEENESHHIHWMIGYKEGSRYE